jgi:Flp pilus assembly protein protease CpaA
VEPGAETARRKTPVSTTFNYPYLQLAVASGILLAGVVDDLRSQKFHNWLFVTCAAIGFVTSLVLSGATGLIPAGMGFFAGFFLLLPLVMLKVIGAGDLKLMAAFGAATSWNAVLTVAVFAVFWGAILGVFRIVLARQAAQLARNMVQIAMFRSGKGIEVHKIPYSVALMFGWLTHLTVGALV